MKKIIKDKWLGHMVRVEFENGDEIGEVVYMVRNGRLKVYIVQFKHGWCWYSPKEMRLAE